MPRKPLLVTKVQSTLLILEKIFVGIFTYPLLGSKKLTHYLIDTAYIIIKNNVEIILSHAIYRTTDMDKWACMWLHVIHVLTLVPWY